MSAILAIEPDELPGCSTPRGEYALKRDYTQTENSGILAIFGLRLRKLVQRTMKYVSRALLSAHRN